MNNNKAIFDILLILYLCEIIAKIRVTKSTATIKYSISYKSFIFTIFAMTDMPIYKYINTRNYFKTLFSIFSRCSAVINF